jgi:hypothetical protein
MRRRALPFSFSVSERKIMNHFVVDLLFVVPELFLRSRLHWVSSFLPFLECVGHNRCISISVIFE